MGGNERRDHNGKGVDSRITWLNAGLGHIPAFEPNALLRYTMPTVEDDNLVDNIVMHRAIYEM